MTPEALPSVRLGMPNVMLARTGYTNKVNAFTFANERDTPPLLAREFQFNLFARVDASGATPVYWPSDPVSTAIEYDFMPSFERLLYSISNTSNIPDQVDIIDYFANVEECFSMFSMVKGLYHLANEFPWDQMPPFSPLKPRAVMELAEAFHVDTPIEFERYWRRRLTTLSAHIMLPRSKEFMEHLFSPFVTGPNDRTVRVLWRGIDNMLGAGFSDFDTELSGIESTLEGLTDVANYLHNFLPWRAGEPNIAYLGVDTINMQAWWNGTVDTALSANGTNTNYPISSAIALSVSTTGLVTTHTCTPKWFYNDTQQEQCACVGDDVTIGELLSIPFYWNQLIVPTTQNVNYTTLGLTNCQRGIYVFEDGGTVTNVAAIGINQVIGGYNVEHGEYLMQYWNRYVQRYNTSVAPSTGRALGIRNGVLEPVVLDLDAVIALGRPASALVLCTDIMHQLDVLTAANQVRALNERLYKNFV